MRKYFYCTLYFSVCLIYAFLIIPLILPSPENVQKQSQFDAVIVLGGGVTTDCKLDLSMQARMDKAIRLYQQKVGRKLILSGGPQGFRGRCIESEAMRLYALNQSIPETDILEENKAMNTYQNAHFSIDLMKQFNMESAIIVTSEYHQKRATLIFDQYNLELLVVSAINLTKGGRKYKQWMKEQLLLCFHTLFGVPDEFGLGKKDQKLTELLSCFAVI